MVELAGTGSVARGALGLNGWLRDRMCQEAMRILRATAALAGLALPWRRLMSVYRPCHGLLGRQACWEASTAAHRRVSGAALEIRPTRELWPDCLIRGVRPE